MKKSFLIFLLIPFVLLGCKKDNIKAILSNNPVVPEITILSTTPYVEADSLKEFPIRWKKTDYSVPVVVNYMVQVDKAGNNFATAKNLGTTTSDSLMFTVKSFNGKLLDLLNLTAGVATDLQIRIVSAYKKDTLFSAPVSLTVTTYQPIVVVDPVYPALYIAGDFQEWAIDKAMRISAFRTDGIYEGYINISEGTREFKLYTIRDWNSESYGAGSGDALIVANCACSNFKANTYGYYQFTANLNTMKFTLTPTTWGIVGNATPGGWDNSTPMIYNAITKTWSVTTNMLKDGSWKFRANNNWDINFGINSDGNLSYADHPVFGSISGINNITVPSDGNYTITLDLSDANKYKYTVVKNP